MPLSHRERLVACLANQNGLDRPPVALWRHFPVDDQDPYSLAEATIAYQNQFDFDLVKVTPASSYCLKDWGVEDQWEGNVEGTRRYTRRVVDSPQDWERICALDPRRARYLSEQLACLRLIRKGISPDIPIIQTIFSPLAQAKNLAGKERLIVHLRQFPEAVHYGLQKIAETTRSFIEAAIDTGIEGVFFAVQQAQARELTLSEYQSFGAFYDLSCLDMAKALWCNILHLHGQDIYFDLLQDYSSFVSIINWHDRETPPSLETAQLGYQGVVCGGINQNTLVYGNSASVVAEGREAIACTSGKRIILGTGCVAPVIAPYGNVMALRRFAEHTHDT